jgi:hypothetical protein
MKWIRVKGKLYNAGQIISIEDLITVAADLVTVRFTDGQQIDITLSEYEKLMEFCGGGSERIEIQEREK